MRQAADGNVHAQQRLEYICDMLAQLRVMMPTPDAGILPQLLDLACLEACDALLRHRQAKETRPPG